MNNTEGKFHWCLEKGRRLNQRIWKVLLRAGAILGNDGKESKF